MEESWAAKSYSTTANSVFRHLTREDLELMESRLLRDKKRQAKKKKKDAERKKRRSIPNRERNSDNSDDDDLDMSEGELRLKPIPKLEQGNDLPRSLGEFPLELHHLPLVDVDPHYLMTFVVISKGGAIYRFSARKSLFLLSPFHPIRRISLMVLTHRLFSGGVILTILLNCYAMILPDSEYTDASEVLFTAVYTLELAVKVLARGVLLSPFTYLRDPWNWLDLIVVGSSYVTLATDLLNLAALRTFRVFRALKSVSAIPGLKTIAGAIVHSVRNLRDVLVLAGFMLAVFALLGLQVYMGVLSQICIQDLDPDLLQSYLVNSSSSSSESNVIDELWHSWVHNKTHWYDVAGGAGTDYVLCGNSSGAGVCPEGTTCLGGIGPNPNHGLTSFDNFGLSYLSAFCLMTQDNWENLYRRVIRTAGPWNVFFFILNIFLGSFYLINIILAIVAMSYDELQKREEMDQTEELEELEELRKSEEEQLKAAEYAVKHNVKTDVQKFVPDQGGGGRGADENITRKSLIDPGKRISLKSTSYLGSYTDDDDEEEEQEGPNLKTRILTKLRLARDVLCFWDCGRIWIRTSELFAIIVFDPFTEVFITLCIVVNVVFLSMDHYDIKHDEEGGMSPSFSSLLIKGNYFFTTIFAVECLLKIGAMSPRYFFLDGWNCFDFLIVVLSIVELLTEGVSSLSMLRSFRLLRVLKLAKYWKSLHRILTIMSSTFGALSNLTFVLCVVIFIFAVLGMQLFGEVYLEKVCEKFECQMPRWNFNDFMHSFMMIFRVLCGEWIEPMWDCIHVTGPLLCVPYFLSAVLIADLVILNLFLALLLSNFTDFGGEDPHKSASEEPDKIHIALTRIKNFLYRIKQRRELSKVDVAAEEAQSKVNQVSSGVTNDRDYEEIFYDPKDEVLVDDCCPQWLNRRMKSCWDGGRKKEEEEEEEQETASFWRGWEESRVVATKIIRNKYFEGFVLILILASSISLTLEDIWYDTRPMLMDSMFYLDRIVTVVFLLETYLRLHALGLVAYFSNAWCWLDFIVVAVSLVDFGAGLLGEASNSVLKTMRTLRALRPLRVLTKMEQMKVVVNALIGALPSIFQVLLVCLIFWLIFAIIGVNVFMGRFYRCVEVPGGMRFSSEVVSGRKVCANYNTTEEGNGAKWINAGIHFDNVPNAYLALLQVATFEGWIEIMGDAVDSVKIGHQPHREANIYSYLYFVFFIVIGSFFTLNLLVGVIIDKFNEQKKGRRGAGSLEAFMTEDQRKYVAAMRKASNKRPMRALPRPLWRPQALVFRVVTSRRFDLVVMGFIGLNMVSMMCDHYQQSRVWTAVLENINVFFVVVFTVEMLLKIFALRLHYFKDPWNVLDSAIVVLSILGLFLDDLFDKYFISPTLLRVIRVAKIGRILRLVKGARGIRTMLFSLARSLPALVNIGLLLFLVMFIFSVFGVSLFKNVRLRKTFDDVNNFQTFGSAFILLFQICTAAGWSEVYSAISDESDCRPADLDKGISGDCGSRVAASAFSILYTMLTFLIIVNMYIAVILENYSQAKADIAEGGLTDEDYDLFYDNWKEFDPGGTQLIPYHQLGDFLDSLEGPLRMEKPNKYRIVNLDIPIVRSIKIDNKKKEEEKNCVFCTDVLDSITQDYFTRRRRKSGQMEDVQRVENIKVASSYEQLGYECVSSSMWHERERYSAYLIQRTFRFFHANI